MTIDSKTLDELDALHAAATPGPWTVDQPYIGFCGFRAGEVQVLYTATADCPLPAENHAYIAAACNALPHLTRRVRELEAELAEDLEESRRMRKHFDAYKVQVNAKIAELEAQLAAAREDSARLDAMSGFGWSVRFFEGRNGNRYEVSAHGLFVASGPTPREAIDSARRLSGGSR